MFKLDAYWIGLTKNSISIAFHFLFFLFVYTVIVDMWENERLYMVRLSGCNCITKGKLYSFVVGECMVVIVCLRHYYKCLYSLCVYGFSLIPFSSQLVCIACLGLCQLCLLLPLEKSFAIQVKVILIIWIISKNSCL